MARFIDEMFDEVDNVKNEIVDTVMEGIFDALAAPFRSSTPSSPPPDDGIHYHRYPCKDEDCPRR